MKAIAVYPGKPDSMHLADVPEPRLDDVPDGRGVLVEVLRVGVDGTDKEINAAEYGAAPPGDDFLVTGHESFGQVVEVGPDVPTTIRPGTFVVASVRRPGNSIYGKIGLQDFTTDDVYFERGINLLHGYLTEYYVEDHAYVFPLPANLAGVGVLLEPTTKKAAFLKEVLRQCKLDGIEARAERLDEAVHDLAGRAALVTLRAVALTPDLLSDLKKLLAPHGRLALFLGERDALALAESPPESIDRSPVKSPVRSNDLQWESPIAIPHSERRVILVGRR